MEDGSLTEPPSYFLEPGYIYFSRNAATMRAVVGSSVAVCLWDTVLKYGGMNHFSHPSTRSRAEATARYGNVATVALVEMMKDVGCREEHLTAQIMGGGHPLGEAEASLGQQNVQVARTVLARKGVTIASEDVGGTVGRKIVFDVRTGELAVLKVRRIRESDWTP